MDNNDLLYIEKYKILFQKEENGYYPLLYDCEVINGEVHGKIIEPNSIIGNWVMFVKYALKTPSKNSSKIKQGNLYLFQWYLSINQILSVMSFKGESWNVMACRQVGKTWIESLIIAYLTCFGNIYADFPLWTSIIGSYSELSVKKLYVGVRLNIYKAIDFFNLLYPSRKLIYGKDGKEINLSDTENKMDIGMQLEDGKQIPYSNIYAFSTETKKDGFSGMCLWIDESSFTIAEQYFTSLHPFLSAYSGTLISTGISTVQSDTLQYVLYNDEKTKKFKYDYLEHIEMIKYNDEEKSKKYKNEVDNYKRIMGENSSSFKVNYSLDMDLIDGKIITYEMMKNNNLLVTDLDNIISKEDRFIVAGLDTASGGDGNDRTVMTITEAYRREDGEFISEVREIVVYNPNQQIVDLPTLFEKTYNLCMYHKIDLLMADSTGLSNMIIGGLLEHLRNKGCKTEVVGFSFSAQNKHQMYQYMENCFHSRKCLLPKEKYLEEHEGWKLLYSELLHLVKERKEGKNYTQYNAPKNNRNIHDDTVASLSLALFAIIHTDNLYQKRQEIVLGKYKFIPRLKKANWNDDINNKIVTNWLWL